MTHDLLGRDDDLRVVLAFVDRAAESGGALLVGGEPGVGKTALLEAAACHATAAGTAVLRVAGVEFDVDADPNPLVVAHAALSRLTDAAATRPLLLVVDDLQWVDPAHARILRFIGRRVSGTRVGVLAAARDGGAGEFPRHDLRPIDDDAATSLVERRFPALSARVRRRLVQDARGNPLALLELPIALGERSAVGSLPAVLPLTERLREAFGTRVRALPPRTRESLLVVALGGAGDAEGLAPAERLGLVDVDESSGRIAFRHPLVRAAVVAEATEERRREVHLDLAAACPDDAGRRAWHLAEAATGPDEHVATLLQESAHRNLLRGAPALAVGELVRAAELSSAEEGRAGRLAEAAYIGAAVIGDPDEAPRPVEPARPTAEPPLSVVLATVNDLLDHDVEAAHRLLAAAVDRADPADRLLAEALHTLVLVSAFGGGRAHWERFTAASPPRPSELLAILGSTFADPARSSAGVLDRLDATIAGLPHEHSPVRIVRVGVAASYVDRLAGCRDPLNRVVRRGEDGGSVVSAVEALFLLGNDAFHSGQWAEGQASVEKGLDLCARHGYQLLARPGRFLRALIGAARGEDVQEEVRELEDWADSRRAGLVRHYARHVAALDALGRRDFDAAYRFATAITPAGRFAPCVPHALWTVLDVVDAATNSGRRAEALAHAVAAREVGALSPRLAFVAKVAEAMTGPDDELFADALATPGADRWPFDLARAELYAGERLRRSGDTARARARLAAAVERFDRLGARPWVARARAGSRAAGARPDGPRQGVALTPRQRRIADLAAAGLTNKEIGARLFLSPRTVGACLYRVFPMLGVTSRAGLRDALDRD
ncbi:AAA family ATPase [Umezawaea sp. NPDC059074]|uniref:helix-turn-helix transcriptional regulator n=1 Tax=Umezawaea sp. NPDC059074 TaxID=3346716 RepID=UPI0036B348E0